MRGKISLYFSRYQGIWLTRVRCTLLSPPCKEKGPIRGLCVCRQTGGWAERARVRAEQRVAVRDSAGAAGGLREPGDRADSAQHYRCDGRFTGGFSRNTCVSFCTPASSASKLPTRRVFASTAAWWKTDTIRSICRRTAITRYQTLHPQKGKIWLHYVFAATLLIVEDAKVDQISQGVRAAGGRVRVNSRLRCQAGTGMGS